VLESFDDKFKGELGGKADDDRRWRGEIRGGKADANSIS
jgi:hypothetical protein